MFLVESNNLPQELGSHGSHLNDPGGQGLSLVEGNGMNQLVLLDEPASHPGGHGGPVGWNNDPDPRVAAAPHGPTPGVHHETDEEAVSNKGHCYNVCGSNSSDLNEKFSLLFSLNIYC